MDDFQVPKKVNRHVLKALNTLSAGRKGTVSIKKLLNEVKYQMRNLVPVANIDFVIQKSLKNLSDIGLINRTEHGRFYIDHSNVPVPAANANKPTRVNRYLLKPSGSRKRSSSQLKSNTRRTQYYSEDSLSGDEYDQTRKRMRNTKKINYAGRRTDLPKSKKHHRKNTANVNDAFDRTFDSFEQNLEMPFNIGPTSNFNPDVGLSNISPLPQPLEITEIFCDNLNNTNIEKPLLETKLHVVELCNKSSKFGNNNPETYKSATNFLDGEFATHSIETSVTNSPKVVPSTKGTDNLSNSITNKPQISVSQTISSKN